MTDKTYSRSASQLNLLTDCGERFYLERFKKIPSRPAAWTARGIAVHEAVMLWEQSGRTIDLVDTALGLYDINIQKMKETEPNFLNWMSTPRTKTVTNDINLRREDVKKQCIGYIRHCENAEWELAKIDGKPAVELPFEVFIDGIQVKGTIDSILFWPAQGLYTLRDMKTGGERRKYYQLGTYRFAAEKIFGLDIHYGEYFYTKLKEKKDSEYLGRSSGFILLDRYTEKYLGRLYRRADRIISDGLFLPSPSKDCEMCPVQKYCSEMGWETWS